MNPLPATTASILCLGTNQGSADTLRQAAKLLMHHLTDLRLSTPTESEPVHWPWPGLFINMVAVTHTTLAADALIALCKDTERQLGRRPHDKEQGIVRIDIDVLTYRGKVFKPTDLQRPYVASGLQELGLQG